MKRNSRAASLLLALVVLGLTGAGAALAQDAVSSDTKDSRTSAAKADARGAAVAAKPDVPKPGDDKPFSEVVKDMDVIQGVFTFYRHADDNRMLMEIRPDQLDKRFLFGATLDQAVGERGIYGAQVLGDFPFVLRQVGKSIQLIQENTAFSAPPGSPAARAIARSFPGSILGAAKLQSKPHPDRKSILIDPAELFVKDLPGFAAGLSQAYQPSSYSFDKEKSGLRDIKAFPDNVLLEVALDYGTDNPRTPSITLPDARSIPLVVKYELSTLKDTGYQPRIADDRVGHFITIRQDFASDRPASPYVRYITRWKLEKSDPNAALSPPKEPIVYWLENTIPVEYREAVTEGVLLWNKAFEKIGFKDAIVVKQQPDDATWDPADSRYNTIRWFAGVDATFAIGPSRANPYTGQIYDADISIAEGIVRNARRLGEEYVNPITQPDESGTWLATAWNRNPRAACDLASGLVQQAALGISVLEARGALRPEVEARLMHQYIVELVAHEVGHTLGLRHNFRGSSILKPSELNDVAKTESIGQSASVMDYNPVIVAPKGTTQGDFVPTTLGPYDYWAIEYAYKPIAGDETDALARIAARAGTDPMLPYSTDEDAQGTYSAISIDPFANQYDQTDDPLAYFRGRLQLVNELWANMESKLAKPGDGYQVYRRAMARGLSDDFRSLVTSSKFIGGIYHHRDHVGDPGDRLPYQPVPAAKQREALDFLATYAFGPRAFQVPASLQNRLAIERNPGLDFATYFGAQRLDFPWHDAVLNIQRTVLTRLYNPITLGRIQDNELRFAKSEKPFKMADLFNGLNATIWSELDAGASEVTSLRRNLQREQLKQLIRLALRQPAPAAGPGLLGPGVAAPPPPLPPEDATTLARASLVRIQGKVRTALAGKAVTDATTRAHLQETDARIGAALAATLDRRAD